MVGLRVFVWVYRLLRSEKEANSFGTPTRQASHRPDQEHALCMCRTGLSRSFSAPPSRVRDEAWLAGRKSPARQIIPWRLPPLYLPASDTDQSAGAICRRTTPCGQPTATNLRRRPPHHTHRGPVWQQTNSRWRSAAAAARVATARWAEGAQQGVPPSRAGRPLSPGRLCPLSSTWLAGRGCLAVFFACVKFGFIGPETPPVSAVGVAPPRGKRLRDGRI